MAPADPTIANYDAQTADEITQRLRKLSQADLAKLESYEKQGQQRSTVLEAVTALRGDVPWSGYDDMEVEEVNDQLKRRDGDAADRVLDYERRHKGRKTIIKFANRSQEATARPSPGQSRTRTKGGSETRTRAQSSKSGSRPNRSAKATSSTSSKKQARNSSASRSRAKASQQAKRPRGGSRSRAGSSKAETSGAQSRDGVPTRIRQKADEARQNTGQAVGSAAEDSQNAVSTAVKHTGQAAQTAAKKAKSPALVGGAMLTALGGGIALARGLNVNPHKRKRVLGVPIPRRTAFGKATKQLGDAVDTMDPTGVAKRLLS